MRQKFTLITLAFYEGLGWKKSEQRVSEQLYPFTVK